LLHGDFQASALFFGCPYWNLGGVKKCLARLPGFVERKFDEDLNVAIQYEGFGVTTPLNLRTLLRALPIFLAVPRVFRKHEEVARRFLESGFDALERRFEAVPSDEPALTRQFSDLVRTAYVQAETNYFRTIYCASIASLLFTDSFPDTEFAALASGLPGLKHMAPMEEMRALAREGRTDLSDIIRKYRHHSRRELDIRVPRWDEEPEFVAALFENIVPSPASPEVLARHESAKAAVMARLSWRGKRSFRKKLDRMRRFLWLREELRDCSSRMYYLIRRYALQIAAVRGLGDEVFFMTWRQILDDDRSAIPEQRERYERYRTFAAPTEVGSRIARPHAAALGPELEGIAASCGRAEGVACVVGSIEEAVRVEAHSILVCPFTDPGWAAVLGRVAGVVTETGGLLSHAAVVCREYGIPAVLAVKDATKRIRDGAVLVVDGDRGTVEIGGADTASTRRL
jgi:pyruvate,water dikinase